MDNQTRNNLEILNDLGDYGDAEFTLTATSSSSAFFAYTIADTDVAPISGTTVTIKDVGTT